MDLLLLEMTVAGKRDLLLARERTRQLAALLGYNSSDQATLSAAVFALACQTLGEKKPVKLTYQLNQQFLEIHLRPNQPGSTEPPVATPADLPSANAPPPAPWRLTKVLPSPGQNLAPADLVWVAQELHQHTPTNVFAEIQRQNQELLQALHELHACQVKLAQLQQFHAGRPAA